MKRENGNSNTITGGNDIDIAISITGNADMQTNSYLMYDFGVDYKNSLEYLDITKLSLKVKRVVWQLSWRWYTFHIPGKS